MYKRLSRLIAILGCISLVGCMERPHGLPYDSQSKASAAPEALKCSQMGRSHDEIIFGSRLPVTLFNQNVKERELS